MLPALLRGFTMEFPDINLKLNVSNTEGIVSMIENSMIDLGVVEGPVANKNLLVEVCRIDQLVVVVPPDHEFASRDSISMEEVMEHPFICREEGSGTREVIMDHMVKLGLDRNNLNVSLELGSPESIKGAVEAGMGISIASIATLEKELQLGTLVAVKLDPPMERAFSFVRQRQKFRLQAMDKLLDYARNYCSDQTNKISTQKQD
jgi:DNA-binding transcriptional LysR family regulator